MKRVSTPRSSQTKLNRVRQLIDATLVSDIDAREWTQEMFAYAAVREGLTLITKNALLSLLIDRGPDRVV